MIERYKVKKDMVLLGKEVKKGEVLTVKQKTNLGWSFLKDDGYSVRIRTEKLVDSLERI